jgi:ankyrin repeat protein
MIRRVCAWLALVSLTGAWRVTGTVRARDVFTDSRVTSLAEAAARGDSRCIAQLAAEGVNVNARGDRGVNLLQWALLNRSKAGLTALLDAGADPAQADDQGKTVVHFAAMANDSTYLEILLGKGADPNTPNGVTRETPIVSALMGEREVQFTMLLQAGADPGRADRMGNTPVHEAAKINEPWRILTLLEVGAPPGARNRQGATFQRYLFMTPDNVISDETRRGRAAVVDWLRRHNLPVEAPEGTSL